MSGPTHSLTIRAAIPARIGMLGEVMAAIAAQDALVGGVDIVRSTSESVTRDVAVLVRDDAHGERVRVAIAQVADVEVEGVADRALLAHAGGKIGMRNRVPVATRDDLSMAYTPGVARVCMAINEDPGRAWDYTIKGNSVMVVSDGSAVVGQGDLGPLAALPAMEAKCMFLRELAGIDAFPLPVTLRDPEAIARTVALCASPFAGVHVADVAAPRCFELGRALAPKVDVPVFQDDQAGTAAALLAALINSLELVGKRLSAARVVVAGLGPGGVATVRLLVAAGVGEVTACDSKGAVHSGRGDLTEDDRWVAEHTNGARRTGSASDLVAGADVFIGLSTLTCSTSTTCGRWRRIRSSSRSRCRSPRSRAGRPTSWCGSMRPDARTSPTRSTPRLRFPASGGGRSTHVPRPSTSRWSSRPPGRSPRR